MPLVIFYLLLHTYLLLPFDLGIPNGVDGIMSLEEFPVKANDAGFALSRDAMSINDLNGFTAYHSSFFIIFPF